MSSINSSRLKGSDLQPRTYIKSQEKTSSLVPKNKEKLLGIGASSQVYEHRTNPNLAIKITLISTKHEFRLGFQFEHSSLVKSHQLFIKVYSNEEKTYKLVMDKVNGQTFRKVFQLEPDVIISLISQTKNCCDYLYQENFAWEDVHEENLMLEYGTNQLKMIDYEKWEFITEPVAKTFQLYVQAKVIIEVFLMRSRQKNWKEIAHPKGYPPFNEINCFHFISKLSNESKRNFLNSYFLAVEEAFKAGVKPQGSFEA